MKLLSRANLVCRFRQALTLDDDSKDVDEEEEAAAADRLTTIYERMKEIGAESADARASKILAGLGFDTAMQVRAGKEKERGVGSVHVLVIGC